MFGFGNRVKNSFVGMIFGVLLIPGSVLLHGWNEYRTVHRSRGLAEAQHAVQSIPNAEPASNDLQGALVHVSGQAATTEVLEDIEFSLRENAIHLARRVEMFQWVEENAPRQSSDSTTSPRYVYRMQWSSEVNDSSRFHEPTGHENPAMHFPSRQVSAETVTVGVYRLNDGLKQSINNWEPVTPSQSAILETLGSEHPEQFIFRGSQLFWSSNLPDPERPRVGDLRISFEKVSPGPVSLVAKLNGNSFEPYFTSNGEEIQRLLVGEFSAHQIMSRLVTENNVLAWGLRFLGFGLCVGGFSLVLGPLKALVSFVPILGSLTGALVFVVSLLLAAVVSLTTIGLSWIAVRPVLGIGLLLLATLAAYVVYAIRKRNQPPVIDARMLV
jgi:hypothetical protein